MRHVEATKAGRWKVRFRHGTNKAGTGLRQASETFGTRKEAEQFSKWLDALGPQGALDQLYAGEQAAHVPTLDQLAAAYIEHKTGITDGTRLTYTRMWARIWSPLLGSTPANRLTKDDIAAAVNHLGRTYSHKTLENQHGLLSGVVQRAVEQGHLTRNHARGIRLPRGQEQDKTDMRIVGPDEFAGLITRVSEHYQPLVNFLYGMGCRWGEAVALQVQDVALPNIRIRRALKWSPDNNRVVGSTKTKKSNRTIVAPDEIHADLRAACEDKTGTELVFTAPRGGPVLHRTFWSRVWLPSVSHLTPRPRIHDLRHSHASWLLSRGVPIYIVQARLGHQSIQTTVDTYGHLLPDAQQMAATAASLAFAPRNELN